MGAMRDVWDALRAVIRITDSVEALSAEVRDLRRENLELRERLVRLETLLDPTRVARHLDTLDATPAHRPKLA